MQRYRQFGLLFIHYFFYHSIILNFYFSQLHTLENGTRDFIIATTAFINGNSLLKTLVVPAGNITK